MITDVLKMKKCSGCSSCVSSCPVNCMKMEQDAEGFLYPEIDKEKCIQCKKCEKVCPILHKKEVEEKEEYVVYAAVNNEEETRLNSSSGGIFSLLADYVLELKGVVVGASFADGFKVVEHVVIEDKKDLDKLRGSKYLQSRMGNCYVRIREYLELDRIVLFTGTPCQIGGLYAFLGKEYENLYTQDLICHGVPSPLVWRKYVEYRENRVASPTWRIFFRHKKYGWKRYSVLFQYYNNAEYQKDFRDDAYMKGFLSDLYLRPSCHNCSFKGLDRQSDITLADFWGIQNLMPEMDDDKGSSLIMINSEKGQKLFNAIKYRMKYETVDADIAVKQYNSASINSAKMHKKREFFFKNIEKYDIETLILITIKQSYFEKCKEFIKRALRKIKRIIILKR